MRHYDYGGFGREMINRLIDFVGGCLATVVMASLALIEGFFVLLGGVVSALIVLGALLVVIAFWPVIVIRKIVGVSLGLYVSTRHSRAAQKRLEKEQEIARAVSEELGNTERVFGNYARDRREER